MDFKKDIKIDPLDLITEWQNQPEKFHDYKLEHAKAVKEKDILTAKISRKEREIEILRAETELDVRSMPSAYGVEKVTDASCRSIVLTQQPVKDAYDHLFKLKEEMAQLDYEVNALDSAYWSFVQRKTALEKITSLYLSDYYATKMGFANEEQFEGLKKTMRKGE